MQGVFFHGPFCQGRWALPSIVLLFIFHLGGHAAADVPLGLVLIQDRFDFLVQLPVRQPETICHVFMNRRFGYAKFGGGLPDRRVVADDVSRLLCGALFG